jgi:hypothetical protein
VTLWSLFCLQVIFSQPELGNYVWLFDNLSLKVWDFYLQLLSVSFPVFLLVSQAVDRRLVWIDLDSGWWQWVDLYIEGWDFAFVIIILSLKNDQLGLLLLESVNLWSGDCELGSELGDFGFVFAELDFVGFWWRSILSKSFDFVIESLDFWVFDHDLIGDEGGFSFVINNFGLKGPDSFGSILNLCFQIFHFAGVSIDRPESKLSEIFF